MSWWNEVLEYNLLQLMSHFFYPSSSCRSPMNHQPCVFLVLTANVSSLARIHCMVSLHGLFAWVSLHPCFTNKTYFLGLTETFLVLIFYWYYFKAMSQYLFPLSVNPRGPGNRINWCWKLVCLQWQSGCFF